MAVRISSPRNRTTRVEPLGPALVLFERGIADLDGDVRPGVLDAARRKRYRISDDDPATPAPKVIRRRRKPASNTPAAPPATDTVAAQVADEAGAEDRDRILGTLAQLAEQPADPAPVES